MLVPGLHAADGGTCGRQGLLLGVFALRLHVLWAPPLALLTAAEGCGFAFWAVCSPARLLLQEAGVAAEGCCAVCLPDACVHYRRC